MAQKITNPNRQGVIYRLKMNPNGQVMPSTGPNGQNKPAFAYFGPRPLLEVARKAEPNEAAF
jgi:hypothetical protein